MPQSRRRRKKRSGKVKLIVLLSLAAILVLAVWLYLRSNINPVVMNMSESTVKAMTTKAVNDAVSRSVGESVNYADLVRVEKDNEGRITLLSANSVKINEIARSTERYAEEGLAAMKDTKIEVPAGAFTGSPLLANTGPKMELQIVPIGSVTARFVSEFESAGINQTRHKMYLEVTGTVNLVIPFSTTAIQTKTQVLITETILVGTVPEVYLKFDGTDSPLPLTPAK